MGKALSLSLRQKIVQLKRTGKKLLDIALEMQLSYSTVRRIWERYKEKNAPGLAPAYHLCGISGPRCEPIIHRAGLWLKRLHPGWGAAFICLHLHNRYRDKTIPVERTLQRWFKTAGLYPRKSRFPGIEKPWATEVHDMWQIDAKEKFYLGSQQPACYLTMVDEKSGALLQAWVFPPLSDQSGSFKCHAASPY